MKYFLAILLLTHLSIVEADDRCNRIAFGIRTCGTGNHTHASDARDFYGPIWQEISEPAVGYQTTCASQYSSGLKVVEFIWVDGVKTHCNNPTAEQNRNEGGYLGIQGQNNPFRKNKTGNQDYEG